jgi:hypothetical protein
MYEQAFQPNLILYGLESSIEISGKMPEIWGLMSIARRNVPPVELEIA